MDTRFNSFYHEDMHPFVDAMVGLLQESGARARRPAVATYFMRSAQQKYDSDIALLKQVAKEVVAERKANPSDKKDLLNAMIKGRDPKTGEGLTDASVLNNMITFLIAGEPIVSCLLFSRAHQIQVMKLPVVFSHSCSTICSRILRHTRQRRSKSTKSLAADQSKSTICQNYHTSKHAFGKR